MASTTGDTATTNGVGHIKDVLPESLSFSVNGKPLTAKGLLTKDKLSWRFEGDRVDVPLSRDATTAMREIDVEVEGVKLSPGTVHTSKPGARSKGGNLTVTYSAIIPLGETEIPFNVQLIATAKVRSGDRPVVVLVPKAFRRGSGGGGSENETVEIDGF